MTLASIVLVVPAAKQADANLALQALGYGLKALVASLAGNALPKPQAFPAHDDKGVVTLTAQNALVALKAIQIDGAMCQAGECFDHWASVNAGKKLIGKDQQGKDTVTDVPATRDPAKIAQRKAEFVL